MTNAQDAAAIQGKAGYEVKDTQGQVDPGKITDDHHDQGGLKTLQ